METTNFKKPIYDEIKRSTNINLHYISNKLFRLHNAEKYQDIADIIRLVSLNLNIKFKTLQEKYTHLKLNIASLSIYEWTEYLDKIITIEKDIETYNQIIHIVQELNIEEDTYIKFVLDIDNINSFIDMCLIDICNLPSKAIRLSVMKARSDDFYKAYADARTFCKLYNEIKNAPKLNEYILLTNILDMYKKEKHITDEKLLPYDTYYINNELEKISYSSLKNGTPMSQAKRKSEKKKLIAKLEENNAQPLL